MTTINNLFCTPEQGKRLAELLPNIKSVVIGVKRVSTDVGYMPMFRFLYREGNFVDSAPLFTLQELRDLIYSVNAEHEEKHGKSLYDYSEYGACSKYSDATNFAWWVLRQLEANP